MFLNRSGDRPVQYLTWRVRLFGVAAILAMFGIGADQGWMVSIAIAVLVVALVLGWMAGREAGGAGEEDGEDAAGDECGHLEDRGDPR